VPRNRTPDDGDTDHSFAFGYAVRPQAGHRSWMVPMMRGDELPRLGD